jgi:pyruvate,water dikinase
MLTTKPETDRSDAFPVSWDHPADAGRSWNYDPMHAPDVMTPLGFDLFFRPFFEGFGAGGEAVYRAHLANYYVYHYVGAANHTEQPPKTASAGAPLGDLASAGARWRDEILPEVQRLTDYYLDTDFAAMPDAELAGEIEKLRDVRIRQGTLHTMAMRPWGLAMNMLVDTYCQLTGGDELGAVRLVQGYGNKSVEAGRELSRLARLASSIPAVGSRLADITADTALKALDEIQQQPDATPFLEHLSIFLDGYGWRSDLFELAAPTWREDPTIPLCQIRAYLEMEDYDPDQERERLVRERDEALTEALSSLTPRLGTALQRAVDTAAELAPVLEDHNFFIDQRLGLAPRRLLLAVGRRLVSRDLLDGAGDVFYLYQSEVEEALRSQNGDYRTLVEARAGEMERWSQRTPPATIGAPGESSSGFGGRFFGYRHAGSDGPNTLTGNGASAGLGRGPARVIPSLAQADRLKHGDVLVARTTMPAWTPLFAVASAIVTETGGILSHAAVTAREYGTPAVLGVENATRTIRDGQILEVDGNRGTVKILM